MMSFSTVHRMVIRNFLKAYRNTIIKAGLAALVVTQVQYLPLYWCLLTDCNYGDYLRPEEVAPAPELLTPWPPILGPGTVPGADLPRLTRAELKHFFFPEDVEEGSSRHEPERFGLVTRRFDNRPIGIRNSGEGREADTSLLDLYERIRSAVPALPEAYDKHAAFKLRNNSPNNAGISVYSALKERKPKRRSGVWNPFLSGEIGKRMIAQGCSAYPAFYATEYAWTGEGAMSPAQKYRVHQGFIGIFHRLGEPTVEHCLFRALMVTLGLHPTEEFFFKEGPVTPEEQAKALAALALLYDPAITPGLDEWHFVQTLLNRNMIDP
jgi:hypothetical protein